MSFNVENTLLLSSRYMACTVLYVKNTVRALSVWLHTLSSNPSYQLVNLAKGKGWPQADKDN